MKLLRDSGSIERGGWRVTRDQHASNPHSPKLEIHPASRSSTTDAVHANTIAMQNIFHLLNAKNPRTTKMTIK